MFSKIAIAATFAIASSAAMAADAPKFYAGADAGVTKAEGSSDLETGFGGFAGYQFNQNFAIEESYHRLASETGSHLDQFALSAVGTLPLSNGFNVFGRVGVNTLTEKDTDGSKYKATRGVYGVGVGYSITPTISARVELQKPISQLTILNAGVVFKF